MLKCEPSERMTSSEVVKQLTAMAVVEQVGKYLLCIYFKRGRGNNFRYAVISTTEAAIGPVVA